MWRLVDQAMDICRSDLACEMAISAVKMVALEKGKSQREIDIKRYAKVEKIPGGAIEDSEVLHGVMINKDVTHARMRRLVLCSEDSSCAYAGFLLFYLDG